ncbi:MAG: deoxyribonuclease IV [Candidatus Caldarchaeum sp.]|nr:deoxyribonuclease IV [Candidatus Caldarchaeum sp.]MCX8200765.1 deoxyribonuclease IV [Candidatus Caldarchaeum sp.]MDW8063309.1 deoxyribonuclease IV [Candidatus Caldarchaeum sp.]MDW8434734.1 deoxyribonuclease IV [Candidatus Caldarchaeum sp.]
MLLGAHVSISGSIDLAVDRAVELGCTTFQIFTRNPRGWSYTKLKQQEANQFREKFRKAGYSVAMAHMPYLPNIASPKKIVYDKSVKSLTAELERCGLLGVDLLVVHIGSHLGAGIEKGISLAANAVNTSIEKVENKVYVLLENMAGQKNSCGSRFEDIAAILAKIEHPDRVGVCLDTCHLLAAGYDIRNTEAVEKTLAEFDRLIGLERLKAVHLNDSKGELGSGLDRHEHIGMGKIGDTGFKAFINHRAIRDKPMVIETPEDKAGNYQTDLAKLRKLYTS